MFQAPAGRPAENHFDARGKPCKQEWPNLPTGQTGAKANANRSPLPRGAGPLAPTPTLTFIIYFNMTLTTGPDGKVQGLP